MTKFDLDNLVRKNIQKLKPYTITRDEYLDKPDIIFLDNCENNYGAPIEGNYERYPSSTQQELKNAIASYQNTASNQIALGNGSDELIDLLIRCFCEPSEDSILTISPTFGMYKVYAAINNVNVVEVPLTNNTFQFDTKAIIDNINANTKLMFLCSPNNPTGTSISYEQLETILNNYNGIVIIDEAYIDFSEKASFKNLIFTYPNLLILQTFSKAWGLASLRLGMLLGNKDIIAVINKVKPPYNINGLTQEIIKKAIDEKDVKEIKIKKILTQKILVKNKLQKFSFVKNIVDSDGNFYLIKVKDAELITQKLLEQGILISNRSSSIKGGNYIRISIGTELENQKLFNALKNIQ